jgi:class 3 adenylate cyclase
MSKKITVTILFVDIMDSMEIANYWGTKKYSDFINEFQRLMQHGICIWQKGIKQIKFAGDELVVFYCSSDIEEDIVNAICLANTLKIMWYAGKPNRDRVEEGKKIFDLGIGINTGDVTYENRPVVNELKKFIKREKSFEGLPISLAKRIESFSRQGRYSRIMVGHRTMAELNRTYHHYEYEPMGLQKFKGMSQEIPVFELKSCYTLEAEIFGETREFDWEIKQLEHIKVFDPANMWLIMMLIDFYRHKNNRKKVEKLCREAIAIDDSVSKIHHELGLSLHEQKKYKEALNHFGTAIKLRWDGWNSYVGKSVCLLNLGNFDECIETCKYAIGNIPTWLKSSFCDELYYYTAAAYAKKGDVKKAITNIEKAIRIGGAKILRMLRKDEGENFCNLYDNADFKRLGQGKRKKNSKGHVRK